MDVEQANETAGRDPLIGKVLAGRFEILELIDRGGMGKVYRSLQVSLNRECAVKTLDIHDRQGEFSQRFFREASVCAKLAHPNTVKVIDYGQSDDGTYFIAMELLRGRTLQQVLETEGGIDPLRAIHIFRQICGALNEAHEAGIVHRDLKPANVFLTPHGDDGDFVKILDFGLVKDLADDAGISQAGRVLGSPLYMSPEQIEADRIDARTDVYAIGLMLYVMLSGKVPYKMSSSVAVLMQQLSKVPPPFKTICPERNIPDCLEWVVQHAIKKDADERIRDVAEFSNALRFCAAQIRGDLPSFSFELEDGRIVTPAGIEVPTATDIPRPTLPTLDNAERPNLEGRSSRRLLFLGALAATLTVGPILFGALVLIIAGISVSLPVPEEPKAVPLPVPATTPSTPEPAVVTRTIVSEPPGAELMEGGALVGVTPHELTFPANESRRLDVVLAGYETRSIVIDGYNEVPTVQLIQKRVPVTRPTKPVVRPVETTPTPPTKPTTGADGVRDPFGGG